MNIHIFQNLSISAPSVIVPKAGILGYKQKINCLNERVCFPCVGFYNVLLYLHISQGICSIVYAYVAVTFK